MHSTLPAASSAQLGACLLARKMRGSLRLRSGALRLGPKVGKAAMICAKSLEALLERVDREPETPRLKRRPARRDTGRGESERAGDPHADSASLT
jgi:hypothetical protein